jgi:hypothetical protein
MFYVPNYTYISDLIHFSVHLNPFPWRLQFLMQNQALGALVFVRTYHEACVNIKTLERARTLSTACKQLRHGENALGVIHEDVIRCVRERTDGRTI